MFDTLDDKEEKKCLEFIKDGYVKASWNPLTGDDEDKSWTFREWLFATKVIDDFKVLCWATYAYEKEKKYKFSGDEDPHRLRIRVYLRALAVYQYYTAEHYGFEGEMSIDEWEAFVHSNQEHIPGELPPGTPGLGGAYEHGLNTYDYLATTKNLKPYGESDYPTLNFWADHFMEEYPVQVTPSLSKYHPVSRRYRIWRPPEEMRREYEEYWREAEEARKRIMAGAACAPMCNQIPLE